MIPTFLIEKLGAVGAKFAVFGTIAALVGVILLLTYCASGTHEKSKQDAATIKVQELGTKADDNAAAARVEDAKRSAQQQQELDNAIDNSLSPDDQRRRSGCVILRQQGRDTSHIPQCAGS